MNKYPRMGWYQNLMKGHGKIFLIKYRELNPVQVKIKEFHFYRLRVKIKC